jgi:hypothetical protein
VLFSRKFILYEDLASVPVQVKRSRYWATSSRNIILTLVLILVQSIFKTHWKYKSAAFQNGKINSAKTIVPQYTMGNQLVYKYDTETQFWAGNSFIILKTKI